MNRVIQEKTATKVLEAMRAENLMNKTVAERFCFSLIYMSWLKRETDYDKIPEKVWEVMHLWSQLNCKIMEFTGGLKSAQDNLEPKQTENLGPDIFNDLKKSKYGDPEKGKKLLAPAVHKARQNPVPAPKLKGKKRGPKKGWKKHVNNPAEALTSAPNIILDVSKLPVPPERETPPVKPFSKFTVGDLAEILASNPELRQILTENLMASPESHKVKVELEISVSLKKEE